MRSTYVYRINNNKCIKCGIAPSRPNRRMCENCKDKIVTSNYKSAVRRDKLGICRTCKKAKTIKGITQCKKCARIRRSKCREWVINLHKDVFNAYGGPVCKCCGETCMWFLTIDHINGNGGKHRSEIYKCGEYGAGIYRWLKKNRFPYGFQVLCMNCNWARRIDGNCPHSWPEYRTDKNLPGLDRWINPSSDDWISTPTQSGAIVKVKI